MPQLDIVIPVYNDAHVLAGSIERLRSYLAETNFPYSRRIVVADNASTDRTLAVAQELAERFDDVAALHLPQKGRGRALRKAWLESDADAVSYMDVDLSTDVAALTPLARAVLEEGYDVASGSRMTRGSQIERSLRRELTSRGFIFLIKLVFLSKLSDTQCGFKALSRQAVQELIPRIENEEWFFDTELLLLAEKGGYRIKEVPVRWQEDTGARANAAEPRAEDRRGRRGRRSPRIPRGGGPATRGPARRAASATTRRHRSVCLTLERADATVRLSLVSQSGANHYGELRARPCVRWNDALRC